MALNIFLHVASDKIKDLSIYGDGRDIWGKIKGTNDWASSIVKRNIADPLKYMNSPIILKPLETVHGTLFFVVPFGPHTEKQHDPMFRVHADLFDDALHHRLRFRLAIKDEVSGATVNIPVPGEYKGE